MTMPSVERRAIPRDPVLDAWRAVSVMLVVGEHVLRYACGSADGHAALHPAYFGHLGVQFFFLISGHLITTLLLREHESNGRVSLAAFYVRRVLRIVPALALALVLCATAAATALGYLYVSLRSFAYAATFLCNIASCDFFVGHTWSLGVEEQFYLVWPLLLCLVGFRAVAPVALALTLLAQAVYGWPGLAPGVHVNGSSFAVLGVGCLYAASTGVRAAVARAALWPVWCVAAILLFARPWIPLVLPLQQQAQSAIQPFLLGYVLFATLRYRSGLGQRRSVRVLARLGVVSYGVYLWQQLFLGPPQAYLRHLPVLVGALAFTAAVSLCYRWLERPLLRLGGRWSSRLIARGLTWRAMRAPPAP